MLISSDKKYQQAVLYFIANCNNKYLGETKLNKLMYYLDFISYRDRGVSVTSDEYIHKDYGPVPKRIDEILNKLKESNMLSISFIPYKSGFTADFKALSEVSMDVFDDYEKVLLDKICKEFFLWPTDKIVNQTHAESPWLYSDPFAIVDYNYAQDIGFFRT